MAPGRCCLRPLESQRHGRHKSAKNAPIPPQITTIGTPESQRPPVVAPGLPVGTRGTRGNDTKA